MTGFCLLRSSWQSHRRGCKTDNFLSAGLGAVRGDGGLKALRPKNSPQALYGMAFKGPKNLL